MSDGVQVVRVTRPRVGVVQVGAAQPTLEQLADVDGVAAAPTEVPLALRKGTDGVIRPVRVDDVVNAAVEDALTGAVVVDAVEAAVGPAVAAAIEQVPRDHPHVQAQASDLWQVVHNLGFRPTFTAYDTDGRPVMHAGISHPVPGQVLEVRFGAPIAGSGYAS